MLYVWYPKNRMDLNTIHEENEVYLKVISGPSLLQWSGLEDKQKCFTFGILRTERT